MDLVDNGINRVIQGQPLQLLPPSGLVLLKSTIWPRLPFTPAAALA